MRLGEDAAIRNEFEEYRPPPPPSSLSTTGLSFMASGSPHTTQAHPSQISAPPSIFDLDRLAKRIVEQVVEKVSEG